LHARLKHLLSHHGDHLRALEAACVEPRTAVELLPVIFKRALGAEQFSLAIGELIAHLHHLMAEGRLGRETAADGLDRYAATDPLRAARLRDGGNSAEEDTIMDFEAQAV
jgi:hypothetical protein